MIIRNNLAVYFFLDLQKAFDTVNHNILLKKLKVYGIRGITNKQSKSVLKGRKQYTPIEGIKSEQNTIHYGVPRGFVPGPPLFIILKNYFTNTIELSAVHHFADDGNLLFSDCFLKKLRKHFNRDLKLANEWICENQLSLNVSKTDINIFMPKCLNSRMGGQKIELNNQVKYLGVILQDDLHWKNFTHLIKTTIITIITPSLCRGVQIRL